MLNRDACGAGEAFIRVRLAIAARKPLTVLLTIIIMSSPVDSGRFAHTSYDSENRSCALLVA